MSLSAEDHAKVETYAATLLEAAQAEGRELEDLDVLEHLAESLDEVNDTMRVILERGDDKLIPLISARYNDLFHAQGEVTVVDVTTAIPLDDDLRQEVKEFLKAEYSGPIQLVETVDPSIIGGIIVNARGERKDASVRTQLENARRTLKNTGSEA